MLLFQQVTYASSAINDATRIAIQMDTVKETDASEYDMEVSLLLSNVFCTTTQPYDILGRRHNGLTRIKFSMLSVITGFLRLLSLRQVGSCCRPVTEAVPVLVISAYLLNILYNILHSLP